MTAPLQCCANSQPRLARCSTYKLLLATQLNWDQSLETHQLIFYNFSVRGKHQENRKMLLPHLQELSYKQVLWCWCRRHSYSVFKVRAEMRYSHPSSANNLAQAAAIPNRPSPTASLLLFQLPALPSYSYSNLLFFNNFFLFILCTLVLCLQSVFMRTLDTLEAEYR